MSYNAPGFADELNEELLARWDETIRAAYRDLADLHTRFFSIDPTNLPAPVITASALWFADPAEPAFCFDELVARQLSDWGVNGRHSLHNEYCEYVVLQQPDATGQMRPKRVHLTTELREYWVCIAMHNPSVLQAMAQQVLGFTPSYNDLYGVADPTPLTPQQRKIRFSVQVAGHGNDRTLAQQGVPAQPIGNLNRNQALFMTHPINGLDDLLYIVLFGAQPYAQNTPGGRQPATKEQIFRQFGVEHLACRHADPAAATAAHQQAYNGRILAFADPLGVYMTGFSQGVFSYQDAPIPNEWIQFSRGANGLYQHLQFGPPDDEAIFLDDILVIEGDSEARLTGGYEIAKRLEVGPLLSISEVTPVQEAEYLIIEQAADPIRCSEAGICEDVIRPLKEQFDNQSAMVRIAPRRMGGIA